MTLVVRPMIGLTAAAASAGFVILAGVTAPRPDHALHISAKCPDRSAEIPLQPGALEAETPARNG